jgi:general secretion pathway protein K
LKPRREAGYAMVVAVTGMMAFGYIAFQAVASNRGAIAVVTGQYEHAKLEAAADAGIAIAIHGLAIQDQQKRWPIDGSPQALTLGGMVLSVSVEDERGKVPMNRLDEDQVRAMFTQAGATGNQLDVLVDSFEDWQDTGDDARPNGAKAAYYAPFGIKERDGPFRTVDELSQIRGMDDDLFEKLKPALTVFFGDAGGFSVSTAQPLALAVMTNPGSENQNLAPMAAYQSTDNTNLIGRPLSVTVNVRDANGGNFDRTAIIELTGSKTTPYWVRYVD